MSGFKDNYKILLSKECFISYDNDINEHFRGIKIFNFSKQSRILR